jgi:hypothetical protein
MTAKDLRIKNFALIEQWRKSGKNATIFCKENKILRSSLYYWHKRYKETPNLKLKKDSKLIPVIVKDQTIARLEILYPNGVKVIISDKIDHHILRTLVYLH